MRISKCGEAGFTFLEALLVVVILSILAAIVAPRIIGRTDDARVVEAKAQTRNFETALKLYKIDNGFYPTTNQGLEALIDPPTTGRIPKKFRKGGYLEQRQIPLDPWDNPYIFTSPGLNGDFDILSLGADGEEGGEDYDADIQSWNLQ